VAIVTDGFILIQKVIGKSFLKELSHL